MSRIILSRELSLEEVGEIRQQVPTMELEVFVHGALCMAYSGRCLLSGYMRVSAPPPTTRTTQVYRRAIDDAVAGRDFDRSLMTDLESLAQCGYTEGFLRQHVHDEHQNYQHGSSVSGRQQFVGELTGERRERLAEVKVKNRFGLGDHLELMTPKGNFHFDLHQMHNARGQPIEVAPGDGHTVYVPIPDALDLKFGMLMRDICTG